MTGLRQIDAQNSGIGSILNATLNRKAAEVAVKKIAQFASRLLHVLADVRPTKAGNTVMAGIEYRQNPQTP